MSPLISIVIPCYRHGKFLADAIDSALSQTHPDIEVVVVNDGSPDNTAAVCASFGNRIRYVEQGNKGLPAARNEGILAASGEYILPLDADDLLHERYVEKTLPVIESDAGIGYVYARPVLFYGDKDQARSVGVPGEFNEWDSRRLLLKNLSCCTGIFRRKDWETVGGYSGEMVYGYEDWDLWLSIVELGRIGKGLDEPLFFYRQHPQGGMLEWARREHFWWSYRLLMRRHPKAFAGQRGYLVRYWLGRAYGRVIARRGK